MSYQSGDLMKDTFKAWLSFQPGLQWSHARRFWHLFQEKLPVPAALGLEENIAHFVWNLPDVLVELDFDEQGKLCWFGRDRHTEKREGTEEAVGFEDPRMWAWLRKLPVDSDPLDLKGELQVFSDEICAGLSVSPEMLRHFDTDTSRHLRDLRTNLMLEMGILPGSFGMALAWMRQGKAVRRKAFPGTHYWMVGEGGDLTRKPAVICSLDVDSNWTSFCVEDLLATDWGVRAVDSKLA